MAIKKRSLARWVIGVVRRDETAKKAVQAKALDVATKDLKEGLRGADLVILCAPVSIIIRHLKEIAPHLKKEALVMDVGSSKLEILKASESFLKNNIFVGCHPMAGSEKCGIEFADKNLFEKALCFMTQTNKKVETFWKALGSHPLKVEKKSHDEWVAKSSHLPHALSFALFQSMSSKYPCNPSLKKMGRLAKSDAQVWADIFLSNRRPVLDALRRFKKDLAAFESTLKTGQKTRLFKFIRHANKQAYHCD